MHSRPQRHLPQIDGGGEPGYDHCYARADWAEAKLSEVVIAVLEDPASGRKMTVSTDCPGVQLYT